MNARQYVNQLLEGRGDTLTVGGLIELLQQYPEETPVYFGYDYGDHWHSEVADKIVSAREAPVEHSEYHRMMKVKPEADDDVGGPPDEGMTQPRALILSSNDLR
jgi:hypothetical protein